MEKNINTRLKSCLLLMIQLLSMFIVFGQTTITKDKFKVYEERLISKDIQKPLSEPHLVVNPEDPNHLLVASIITDEWIEASQVKSHILLMQSHDNGLTWLKTHFDTISLGADPWLSFNNKGTVVLSMLGKLKGKKRVHLLTYISNDQGETWSENPLDFGNGHDRQSIAIDPVTQNFIIASAKYHPNADNKIQDGLMITRLSSWGSFIETNWHPISNLGKNNGTPIFTHTDELLIPYVDYSINNKMVKTRRQWLIKTKDLGKTVSSPFLINEDKNNIPQLLLDTVNFKTPKIHQLWREGKMRVYKGISTSTSVDNGYSWSSPVDIGQYSGEIAYMREPQWVINKKGVIGVFWHDGRINPNNDEHHLFFSHSQDGGKTFSIPQPISSKASKPNFEVNGNIDKRFPTGGDYFGLSITKEDNFRVIWVDHRDVIPRLYHAIVIIKNNF